MDDYRAQSIGVVIAGGEVRARVLGAPYRDGSPPLRHDWGEVEYVPAGQLRAAIEENAILERALAFAVRNGEARDPEAAVEWFKRKARERIGIRTDLPRWEQEYVPAEQLRGAVEAARAVIEAAEPCAVGNRHVLVEHLDALAKACGLPPVRGR